MKTRGIFKFLTLCIMLLIFWFSHQDGNETMKQSRYVEKSVKKVSGIRTLKVNVRKNAHFYIYLALGMSSFLSRSRRGKKEMLEVLGFVVLYAISDEYHQSFIPGRGPSIYDVGIDSLGGFIGIVVVKGYLELENILKLGEKEYEKSNKSSYTSSRTRD